MTEPMHEPQQADVPVEAWRRDLEQISEAPSTERHGLLSTLLDDLDAQVSSL